MTSPSAPWQPPSDGASLPSPDATPSTPAGADSSLPHASAQAPAGGPTGTSPAPANEARVSAPSSPPQEQGVYTYQPPLAPPSGSEPASASASGVGLGRAPARSDAPLPGAFAPTASFPPPAGFSVAPKPGIIPLRPLSIGEILSGAFEALRANPRAMFLPALAVMGVIGLIEAAATWSSMSTVISPLDALSEDPQSLEQILSPTAGLSLGSDLALTGMGVLLQALAQTVLTGLLIVVVSRSVLGQIVSPSQVWARVRSRVWGLIGQSLLIALINGLIVLVTGGIVLLLIVVVVAAAPDDASALGIVASVLAILVIVVVGVVAALFTWVRLALSPAALVLENTSVTGGMRRSWELTRGSFWRVLGILLICAILVSTVVGIASSAIALVPALLAIVATQAAGPVSALATLLSTLVASVAVPFSAAVYALTYIDLRMRREGLDVELRRATAQPGQ